MPERYEIKGKPLPDGSVAISPKDLYNLNKNFETIGLKLFGNINFTADVDKKVKAVMSRVTDAEGNISRIDMEADALTLSVEGKVGENEVISSINLSPEEIKIRAEKISIEGLTTINDNFKVLLDGSIEAKNGKFNGEINTLDGAGRAVRVLKRNLVYYSPTDGTVRGILSSATRVQGVTQQGLSVLIPQRGSGEKSFFEVSKLDTWDDVTGAWTSDGSILTTDHAADGVTRVVVGSDTQFSAPYNIQAGFILLNKDTPTAHTFVVPMKGAPVICLTPTHSITGAVITAKVIDRTATGFSAIIQGSPTSSEVYFNWIAVSN